MLALTKNFFRTPVLENLEKAKLLLGAYKMPNGQVVILPGRFEFSFYFDINCNTKPSITTIATIPPKNIRKEPIPPPFSSVAFWLLLCCIFCFCDMLFEFKYIK